MTIVKPAAKHQFPTANEDMLIAVVAFAQDPLNEAITDTIPEFADLISELQGNNASILNLRAQIAQSITGHATQKLALKNLIAQLGAPLMKAAYTYALNVNDTVLAAAMKTSLSKIKRMKYVSLVPYMSQTVTTLSPIAASLAGYNVTPAQIAALETAVTDLGAILSTPKNAIAFRKSINENIQSLLRESMIIVTTKCDALAFQFRAANLNYYNNYLANRKLIPMTIHTKLRLFVKDRFDSAVTSGEAFIIGTPLSGSLDNKGFVRIEDIPFGLHRVMLTTSFGENDLGIIEFKKGHSVTLHVVVGISAQAPVVTKTEEAVTETA